MNDLNPPLGNIRNGKRIRVTKDTSSAGLSLPKEENRINSTQSNPSICNDAVETSMNLKLDSKSSSGRLVNESAKIFKTQDISPPLFNETDDLGVNSGNENSQQSLSGGHAKSLPSESSNNRAELTTHYDAKDGILDGIDVRKKESNFTEVNKGRRLKKSSASSDKSLSLGSSDHNSRVHTKSSLPVDSSALREKIEVGILDTDKRRHSTELDMAEIEERRRRDSENRQEETSDCDKEDASSTKSSRGADDDDR
jgi:hypothetical protein